MTKNLYPYIRGTNRKYGTKENGGFWGENGYNCIEAGYIEISDSNEVIAIYELTGVADVIHPVGIIPHRLRVKFGELPVESIGIDCLDDGYLRIFSTDGKNRLKWRYEVMPLSSMEIEVGYPDEKLVEELYEKRSS